MLGQEKERVFTPIFRVCSQERPLVSSPVRFRCINPAPRWPMQLQPRISPLPAVLPTAL